MGRADIFERTPHPGNGIQGVELPVIDSRGQAAEIICKQSGTSASLLVEDAGTDGRQGK